MASEATRMHNLACNWVRQDAGANQSHFPLRSKFDSPRLLMNVPLIAVKQRKINREGDEQQEGLIVFISKSQQKKARQFESFSSFFLLMSGKEYYRHDGVRITHDPHAPGMEEKYGAPGQTDSDGFDPYADSVGPGIYGGKVKRDPTTGAILYGQQYQNHNSRPGPIYSGEGASEMTKALHRGSEAVLALLAQDSALVNEISTGGATPLHMCGMSHRNQLMTELIIEHNGNIEALDTYGMTPLHRMASNNLAIGAEALLKAGADPNRGMLGSPKETPLRTAIQSNASSVIRILLKYVKAK